MAQNDLEMKKKTVTDRQTKPVIELGARDLKLSSTVSYVVRKKSIKYNVSSKRKYSNKETAETAPQKLFTYKIRSKTPSQRLFINLTKEQMLLRRDARIFVAHF